jgi:hypothetical protein
VGFLTSFFLSLKSSERRNLQIVSTGKEMLKANKCVFLAVLRSCIILYAAPAPGKSSNAVLTPVPASAPALIQNIADQNFSYEKVHTSF